MSTRYGIHGDPLPPGKLDLPELREMPTEEDLLSARAFIAVRSWREAVTYRETAPHEYVVRKWEVGAEGQAAFDRFVIHIRRFGFADFYYRVRHIYWAVDDYKYWTMGWPVAETVVINRAPVNGPEPWKRAGMARSDTNGPA
jgi:hypothetical protein